MESSTKQPIEQLIANRVAKLDELRELGLDQRATLLLVATNGLALQEHGDLFGETMYAPVTRVPLLVRFPGGSSAGTNSKVVEVMDLMPTLLELNGVELPAGVQGASLLPIIESAREPRLQILQATRSEPP